MLNPPFSNAPPERIFLGAIRSAMKDKAMRAKKGDFKGMVLRAVKRRFFCRKPLRRGFPQHYFGSVGQTGWPKKKSFNGGTFEKGGFHLCLTSKKHEHSL